MANIERTGVIVVRTPLRISFVGGGTDFREYYGRGGGSVLSAAIDKYIYVIVKRRFDDAIRVAYSNTEFVDNVDEIEHELVRECLKRTGIEKGIEISTLADIPSQGCGLGSSSAVTIGLLNALYAYTGVRRGPEELAQEACEIEIDVLGKPIGKQDQYIAAYGGVQHIIFNRDDTVSIDSVWLSEGALKKLQERLLLFYTGMTRKSADILTEQKATIGVHIEMLDRMKDLVPQLKECLLNGMGPEFGQMLDWNWRWKKQLASDITNAEIDAYYAQVLAAGAIGGKICGAGGGGFLLVYCLPRNRSAVIEAAKPLRHVPFRVESTGSTVLMDSADNTRPIPAQLDVGFQAEPEIRQSAGIECAETGDLRCPTCHKKLLIDRGERKLVLKTRILIFDNGSVFSKCPFCKTEVPVPIRLLGGAGAAGTGKEEASAEARPNGKLLVRLKRSDLG